jgi:hypothetical protein
VTLCAKPHHSKGWPKAGVVFLPGSMKHTLTCPKGTIGRASDFKRLITPNSPGILAASRHLPNLYVQHLDASIEKEILWDLSVTVSYFGRGAYLR